MIHGLLDGFAMNDRHTATHLSRRMTANLINTFTIDIAYKLLPHGFLSMLHCHYDSSSAYIFTMSSAPMPFDAGASWPDYIPPYLNGGFTDYALRLTEILQSAFALGFPLQTESPLLSPV